MRYTPSLVKRAGGPTGVGWVLAQIPVLALGIVLPPATGTWLGGEGSLLAAAGLGLTLVGMGLAVAAARQLGPGLTPLPVPKPQGKLQRSGPYRFVRHPIYAGAVLATLGWALCWGSWPGAAWAVVVLAFFDRKATFEETELLARFPEYASYRQRTGKFFPLAGCRTHGAPGEPDAPPEETSPRCEG